MTYLFNQISNIPVLSKEEEKALFEKAAAGDKNAKDKIITSNVKFVIKTANKYTKCGLPIEDIIQSGIEGLLIAYCKFDYTKNIKFISYAVSWINQTIKEFIYNSGKSVRIPIHRADLFNSSNYSAVSLDTPIDSNNSESFIGNIEDEYYSDFENRFCEEDLVYQIMEKIETFPANEKNILKAHYGLSGKSPKNYRQIASELNYSHETIRTYEKKSLSKLRKII